MSTTTRETTTTTTTRLPARPRMNIRESGGRWSWRRTATMWTADIMRMFGPEPTTPCERGNPHGCARRRCDACIASHEWTAAVLALVSEETGWRLYRYSSGPGCAFASDPVVYSPGRGKRPTLLRVSWSGGLDI